MHTVHICTHTHSVTHTNTHIHTPLHTYIHTWFAPLPLCTHVSHILTREGLGAQGERLGIAPKKPNPLYQTARCHSQSWSLVRWFLQAGGKRHEVCSYCQSRNDDTNTGVRNVEMKPTMDLILFELNVQTIF